MLLIVSLFSCFSFFGQRLKIGISYENFYSPQWDKAIQTYNFNRPFLTEKQPLIMHGTNVSFSQIFKSEKKIKKGIYLDYSYFRSDAANTNFENILQFNRVNLGYFVHIENEEKFKGFYSDFIISTVLAGLYKNVNGQPAMFEEKSFKSFGIGGEISILLGYHLKSVKLNFLSPFLSLGYSPYYYSPNSEAVINDTKTLIINPWINSFNFRAGISFRFGRK